MPYLNVDLDYFDHPKTIRLINLLGRGSEVLPLRLWAFLGRYHSVDGRLAGYSSQEIELTLKWTGESGKAVEGLIATGFLDKIESGYKAHDWKHYQGHIHALKVRNKKVALNRWKKLRDWPVTVDTSGIPKSTTSVPQPTIPTNGSDLHLEANEISFPPTPQTNDVAPAKEPNGELLDRLVEFAASPQSRDFYGRMVRRLGPGIVEQAMGEVKMRDAEGTVENKAKYLTGVLKNWAQEL